MDDIEKNIEITRRGFEQSFQNESLYNKQTADDDHLKLLLDLIDAKNNETIVDLGTGTGYISFPLAEYNPTCDVIGMDVVADTLKRNAIKAKQKSNYNLKFAAYDGRSYPLADTSIDTIVTRYALHHFLNIEDTFLEMNRVLKKGGKVLISDPTPNEDDIVGFVDEYMQMKQDGHVKFYSFSEFDEMLIRAGFRFEFRENTTIRFPRKNPKKYKGLLTKTAPNILESYEVEVIDDEIWIKENVLNIVYRKV